MRRTVDRQAAEVHPYLVWNAFVDLVAKEEYASLSVIQRQGHLMFWYESQVQNGGHLQFFLNRGTDRLDETIDSLEMNGLPCHASVLRRAGEAWRASGRQAPVSVEAFVELALEAEFAEFDDAFHRCAPNVHEGLVRHLERNRNEYVTLG
jgi:hypothetical protein